MQALEITAGAQARQRILENGFTPELFTSLLGASGGPKWFVLCGLDKILFPEFLNNSQQHIDIIGSSVGAFRSACFTQQDPSAAIQRLADEYSTTVYSKRPTVKEVTEKGLDLLKYMLDSDGVQHILHNPQRSLNIIAARCYGALAKESRLAQSAGLMKAALANYRGRQHLTKYVSRVVVSSASSRFEFSDNYGFGNERVEMSTDNIYASLMASGSIPMVIQGVENLPGAPLGTLRDGGIIDYHFDIKIKTPGLVLYPHFYSTPIPGWFDKKLKKRQCAQENYDNVVMLSPTPEFVSTLPYGKIPDRKDFSDLAPETRIRYWKTVISDSERLADSFLKQIQSPDLSKIIQPIQLAR